MSEECGAVVYSPDPPHVCAPPYTAYSEELYRLRPYIGDTWPRETYADFEPGSIFECCCGEIWVVGWTAYQTDKIWKPWHARPYTEEQAIKFGGYHPPKKSETTVRKRRWFRHSK